MKLKREFQIGHVRELIEQERLFYTYVGIFRREQFDNHLKHISKVCSVQEFGLHLGHVLKDTANIINKEFWHETQLVVVHLEQGPSH